MDEILAEDLAVGAGAKAVLQHAAAEARVARRAHQLSSALAGDAPSCRGRGPRAGTRGQGDVRRAVKGARQVGGC